MTRPSKTLRYFFQRRRQEGVLIAAFALIAGLLVAFVLFSIEVHEGNTVAFDRAVLEAMRTNGDLSDPIGPQWLEASARDITALGSYAFLGILTTTLVGYLLLVRQRNKAALIAIAMIGASLINNGAKVLFERARPEIQTTVKVFSSSYPSGHATLTAAVFLTLGALLAQMHRAPGIKVYFTLLAVLLTAVVGISRIYLGVHYASDVLAGWMVGSAWALLCWTVMRVLGWDA